MEKHHGRKPRKRKQVAILGVRVMAAAMALLFVCSNLYHDTIVTTNLRKSMGFEDDYNYNSNHRGGSTGSDLDIYPHAFQRLWRQWESQTPPTLPESDPSSRTDQQRAAMRHEFRRRNREAIYSLLLLPTNDQNNATIITNNNKNNMDTLLLWGDDELGFIYEHIRKRHKQGLYEAHDMVGRHLEGNRDGQLAYQEDPTVALAAWGNVPGQPQAPRVIEEQYLCDAFWHAKEYANFSTPHVLVSGSLNENWGMLSSEVPGRTGDWGDIVRGTFGQEDCDPMEVKTLYLDSPHTLAVFTSQHQALFDHPKVHSLPVGVAFDRHEGRQRLELLQRQQQRMNLEDDDGEDPRPQLLMINSSPTKIRMKSVGAVMKNFAKAGVKLKNTYDPDAGIEPYYEELSRSKFILCPSGIGWDSYRIWEAIMMGAIPVIERYKYRYEALVYPPETHRLPTVIRTLKRGEPGGDMQATRKTRDANRMRAYLEEKRVRALNASLQVIEYYDGWRKTLDDLPVVWIDGEFEDVPPPPLPNNKDNQTQAEWDRPPKRNYLTPDFLEAEYDALAAKMETFRYEKMTSLYWIRMMESYLLLKDPSKALNSIDGPKRFDSAVEQQRWESAMKDMSSTFNNHSMLVQRNEKGRSEETKADAGQGESVNRESGYLLGRQQPRILSWILLIQLKLLGLAMVIYGWTKLKEDHSSWSDGDSKIEI